MKIAVKSCVEAFQYVYFREYGNKNIAIISIQEIENGGNGFVFTKTNTCKEVLTLYFSDINPEILTQEEMIEIEKLKENGYCKFFDKNDAIKIKEFVSTLEDLQVDILLIHCAAGVSRSMAIAAAIDKYLTGNDSWYFENGIPNKYVYNLLLKELENN